MTFEDWMPERCTRSRRRILQSVAWENVWLLPEASYDKSRIDVAVKRALAEFEGMALAPLDPELAEFANDFARDEADAESFEFAVIVPRRWLDEGDAPRFDADTYTCAFSVVRRDDDGWQIVVDSNQAENRDAGIAVSYLASRVSVLLGGPEDAEPM